MKPSLRLSPIDPFATLINLMGAALTGTPAVGGTDGYRSGARDEPPLPMRPEPSEGAEPDRTSPRKASRSLIDRLDDWAWRLRQRDLEASLASSADIAELEARLRARERATLHRYY